MNKIQREAHNKELHAQFIWLGISIVMLTSYIKYQKRCIRDLRVNDKENRYLKDTVRSITKFVKESEEELKGLKELQINIKINFEKGKK